ncbi:MAG: DUF5683 domain-containing protein [Fibrobacterota bacterium]
MKRTALCILMTTLLLSAGERVPAPLLIVPGAPNAASGEYLRGGINFSLAALMGISGYGRREIYHRSFEDLHRAEQALENIRLNDTASSGARIEARDNLYTRQYTTYREKIRYYNYTTWFGGVAAWSLFDGLNKGYIDISPQSAPDPRRAMRLGAIPFLGLGQIHNGKSYKAGFIWTTQTGCLLSAINMQHTMDTIESFNSRLARSPEFDSLSESEQAALTAQWEDRYERAKRERTMFMWYGIMAYLYGIFDAYIDAHLYDFDSHFRIGGTLTGRPELRFTWQF